MKPELLRKVLGSVTPALFSGCDMAERANLLDVGDEVWKRTDRTNVAWLFYRDDVARFVLAAVAVECGEICAWLDTRPSRAGSEHLRALVDVAADEFIRVPPSQALRSVYGRFGLERSSLQGSLVEEVNRKTRFRSYDPEFRLAYWLYGGIFRYLEFAYGVGAHAPGALSYGASPQASARVLLEEVVEYGEAIREENRNSGWLDVPREFALVAAAFESQQKHRGRWRFGWFTEEDVAFHREIGLKLGAFPNPFLPPAVWAAEQQYFQRLYFEPARRSIRADVGLETEVVLVRSAHKGKAFRRWPKAEYTDAGAERWGTHSGRCHAEATQSGTAVRKSRRLVIAGLALVKNPHAVARRTNERARRLATDRILEDIGAALQMKSRHKETLALDGPRRSTTSQREARSVGSRQAIRRRPAFLKGYYRFVSVEGSHRGIPADHDAQSVLRLGYFIGTHLLEKFFAWRQRKFAEYPWD